MHPVLIQFGPIHVFSYGFAIALGLILVFWLVSKRGSRHGLSPQEISDLIIGTTVSGLIGARLFYVLEDFSWYREHWLHAFYVWEGGLILYGGTLAGLAFVWWISRKKKLGILTLTDIMVPYFALVQGFGRIGCFLNGCCGGKATSSFLGVVFPGTYEAVYPTQLFSSLFCFLLAGFLFFIGRRRLRVGVITLLYFMIYSMGRFLIECLRVNEQVWHGLTLAQVVSLILGVIATVLFVVGRYWESDIARAERKKR